MSVSFVTFVRSTSSAPIFAIFAVSMATTSRAFVHHGLSRPHASNNLLLSKGGPANDGPVFYDDFGESELNSKSEREDRMLQLQMDKAATKVKEGEIAYESKIARNWRRGNWSVRGFALDYASQINVSAVAAPTSAAYTDATMAQDRALPDGRTVAVGRTDGSVFVVKVGDEYLTNFVENKRVEAEYFQYEEEDLRAPQPFEVLCDFQASEPSLGSINKILYIDDLESDSGNGVVCTSAGISGQISVWSLPSTENIEDGAKQVATIGQVDSKQIISLALVTVSLNDDGVPKDLLVSVSCDGKISFFDIGGNFDEIASCKCVEDDKIICADVSTSNDGERGGDCNIIYLGTSSGNVVGFQIKSLLKFATSDVDSVFIFPTADMKFRAHGADTGKGDAVTAIKCGGIGTIPATANLQGRSNSDATTSSVTSKILFTGGEDGSIKQWEILGKETSNGDLRLEHWPRMKTQRMKRRAHMFLGHSGKVTCISQQSYFDNSKFISSGEDGTVFVWNAAKGEELFRMDGFCNISSLACLGREVLVTDGMDGHVCLHDFGVEEDAASRGYELEW